MYLRTYIYMYIYIHIDIYIYIHTYMNTRAILSSKIHVERDLDI